MTFQWEDVSEIEFRKLICSFTAEDPDKAYRFVNDVDCAKERIMRDPRAPREFEHGYRKIRLGSFPYTLVYAIVDETIWVVAFFHNSRHPDYWKRNS